MTLSGRVANCPLKTSMWNSVTSLFSIKESRFVMTSAWQIFYVEYRETANFRGFTSSQNTIKPNAIASLKKNI